MYLKEKLIKFLKVICGILTAGGVFEVATSGYVIVSLLVYYSDKIETALNAKAMPDSVVMFVMGIIFLIASGIIKRLTGDAVFYSSYFENSLDEQIEFSELSEITGRSILFIRAELFVLRIALMKNFDIVNVNKVRSIKLKSKKYKCQCGKCGAEIEKSMYFAGECEYCGSSDIFAKVITDDRFYCISGDNSEKRGNSSYYMGKHIKPVKVLYICLIIISILFIALSVFFTADSISNYNDKEYLREVLLSPDNHLFSYDLIKADILDSIIFGISIILAFLPAFVISLSRFISICTAETCAGFFSRSKTPFIKVKSLPQISSESNKKMKRIKTSIRRGYLTRSTFEKHGDEIMVALAKKIVKDQCPTCGAPVKGVADENYKCAYCGNLIMEVVAKK